jgi:hypothetical protein
MGCPIGCLYLLAYNLSKVLFEAVFGTDIGRAMAHNAAKDILVDAGSDRFDLPPPPSSAGFQS